MKKTNIMKKKKNLSKFLNLSIEFRIPVKKQKDSDMPSVPGLLPIGNIVQPKHVAMKGNISSYDQMP